MHRKLISTCAALAAFMAFAVLPAIASASPVITYPTGTVIGTNLKVRAHNVGNTVMTTSAGNIICANTSMTGNLVANTGSQFEINVETASFTGPEPEERCPGPLGATKVTIPSLPWCLRSTQTADGFEMRGGTCNEASRALTLTLDMGGLECKYSRAGATGTFTTHPEDAKFTVSEQEFSKEGGSFLCPASFKLDKTFTLERDTEGTAPIYIS